MPGRHRRTTQEGTILPQTSNPGYNVPNEGDEDWHDQLTGNIEAPARISRTAHAREGEYEAVTTIASSSLRRCFAVQSSRVTDGTLRT